MQINYISSPLMIWALLVAFPLHAEILTGRVVGITDGDTITVLDANRQQYKIWLMGSDAPEHDQAFGERSRQNLASLVFGKNVSIEWRKKHRKRLIGKVAVSGVDANLEQVKAGMAWWYERYRKEQAPDDQRRYEQAQLNAQLKRTGLWADKNAMPPWDWRKAKPINR